MAALQEGSDQPSRDRRSYRTCDQSGGASSKLRMQPSHGCRWKGRIRRYAADYNNARPKK